MSCRGPSTARPASSIARVEHLLAVGPVVRVDLVAEDGGQHNPRAELPAGANASANSRSRPATAWSCVLGR